MLRLVLLTGDRQGASFPLSEGVPVVIGRHRDNAIFLSDPTLARRHCQVEVAGGLAQVRDMNSPCGSSINGNRMVLPEHELRPGDVLRVGRVAFRLEQGESMTESRWQNCTNPDASGAGGLRRRLRRPDRWPDGPGRGQRWLLAGFVWAERRGVCRTA